MFKKGDLVEVVELDDYSEDFDVTVGMIAMVVEKGDCVFVKVKFLDDSTQREYSIILYEFQLKLIGNKQV